MTTITGINESGGEDNQEKNDQDNNKETPKQNRENKDFVDKEKADKQYGEIGNRNAQKVTHDDDGNSIMTKMSGILGTSSSVGGEDKDEKIGDTNRRTL